MLCQLILSAAGLLAVAVATSHSSPLEVVNTASDGSFTFTLAGPENYSVNTQDFWTNTYYVPPLNKSAPVCQHKTPSLKGFSPTNTLALYTVIVTNASVVTGDLLRGIVADYAADDVFTMSFLQGVEIQTVVSSSMDTSAMDYLSSLNLDFLLLSKSFSSRSAPSKAYSFGKAVFVPAVDTPPGPYVADISSGALSARKVYRLFSDYQEAFYNGVVSNDDGSFSAVGIWNSEQYAPLIPVPSKLYSSRLDKAKYPLAGLRFGLKDLMPVKGIVTTGGSRAYARLYDTQANETAPAIERLLSLGAVLVGKTKLSTFAYGSYAYQNMDYSYSWNIRGDGFLGLSASSFGSAAAMAAYEQLDFTVGSDTTGSVRNPADRVGVYGMRPSWGAIDLTKVIPSSTSMDTLGVFARSPSMLQTVMGSWQAAENSPLEKGNFSLPKKIFYPTEWYPVNSSVAQTLIDSWLANMTTALGMDIVEQNVTELFQATVAENETLSSYTSDIGLLTKYDNWNLFGKQFVSEYKARFDGRAPEADNQVLTAWRAGQKMNESQKAHSEDRMASFGSFVNAEMIPFSNETCTEGLWVYQIEDTGGGVPEYRDVLNYDYFPPFKPMRAASMAPFAKLVDVTVPIGTVPYDSVISEREEELVITLSFVAHHGCDTVLMSFLAACEEAGFCRPVQTGVTAW